VDVPIKRPELSPRPGRNPERIPTSPSLTFAETQRQRRPAAIRSGSQRVTKSTEVEHGTLQLTDENKLLSIQVPSISIQREQVESTERFGPYNSIGRPGEGDPSS